MFDLIGKTAFITGASKGIGERCAYALSSAGAKVIIAARQLDSLKSVADNIIRNGYKALPIQLDVTDKHAVNKCFDQLAQNGEVIDILINNAGISMMTPVFESKRNQQNDTKDYFQDMLQTNVMGVWYVTKAVANHMKEKCISGSIINIASVCGSNRLRANLTGYCASKAAVIQMTKALVGELATANIRINCISPGLFHTPLNDDRIGIDETRKQIEKTIPLHFIADPCEIDGAILYLSSNKASRYVTGSCLTVDGGASWGGVYDYYVFKDVVY
ncbi:MAG: SDR family oxidoreductase [Candidatus Paracaedibacteraceae bacterium]|nr:SDR family oxidoreductase [Candidatus Paracaedibacteraceae bacterium]